MGVNREKEGGKHMKRKWMVWPLALGMVLLLAACGGGKQQESLVGSWTGQVDMMDQVVEGMNLTAPEIAQELEMEAFNLTLEMEFRDDNTYTMTVDQDKLDESIEELIQKTVDATLAHLEQELKDQGITDITVDEALAQSGMDRESFTQLMRDSLSQLSRAGRPAAGAGGGPLCHHPGRGHHDHGLRRGAGPGHLYPWQLSGEPLS